MANLTVQELTTIVNSNYQWASFLGRPAIINLATEEPILTVDDRRIYFREQYLPYSTSELFLDQDEAMIAATAIFNSHF
jgi:hypothetical protein